MINKYFIYFLDGTVNETSFLTTDAKTSSIECQVGRFIKVIDGEAIELSPRVTLETLRFKNSYSFHNEEEVKDDINEPLNSLEKSIGTIFEKEILLEDQNKVNEEINEDGKDDDATEVIKRRILNILNFSLTEEHNEDVDVTNDNYSTAIEDDYEFGDDFDYLPDDMSKN